MATRPKQPEEIRISRSEAERITGWSSRSLKRMATEGFIKAPTAKGYEVMDLLQGTNLWARKGAGADTKEEMAKEKLLKLKADRERAEHELAISKREMVPTEELEARGAKMCASIRSEMQFLLCDRLPATCAGMDAGQLRLVMSEQFAKFCKKMQETFGGAE